MILLPVIAWFEDREARFRGPSQEGAQSYNHVTRAANARRDRGVRWPRVRIVFPRAFLPFIFLPAFLISPSVMVHAQPVARVLAASQPGPASLETVGLSQVALSLASLTGASKPIALRDQASFYRVTVPLPASETVMDASLHLLGMSSASLVPGESQLLVSFNGEPVRQIALGDGTNKIDREIGIPRELFKAGGNELTFSVTQESQQSCEPFDAPQLWTEISQRSQLLLTYRGHPPPLSFSDLKAAFSERDGGAEVGARVNRETAPNVMILYDAGLTQQPDAILAAAQSIALLRKHGPVRVMASPLDAAGLEQARMFAGSVVILKLASHRRPQPATRARQAREAILTLTRNGRGSAVLIIAGPTPTVLARAARLVGADGFAWPGGSQAVISFPVAPKRGAAVPEAPTSDSVTLGEAGFPTATQYGPRESFGPVPFWNSRWDSHAVLYAHLAYSGGAAAGSQIEVLVNGNMVGTIPLANPVGGNYPNYRLLVPSDALHVGENRLTMKPIFELAAQPASKCATHKRGQSLAVTMFSDSKIAIIGGSEVPANNLAAIGAGVYPINTIAITTPTPAVISAAATLGAKLGEVDHRANARMVDAKPGNTPAGAIVIGPAQAFPSELARSASLVTAHSATAIIEQPGSSLTDAVPAKLQPVADWVSGVVRRIAGAPSSAAGAPQGGAADPAIGNFASAMIVAIAHPADVAARTTTVPTVIVTAQNSTTLEHGVAALVAPKLWARLSGSAAVVEPNAGRVQTVAASARPLGTVAMLGYLASNHPALTILVTCGLLLIVVVVLRALVMLRRHWLYPTVRSVDQK